MTISVQKIKTSMSYLLLVTILMLTAFFNRTLFLQLNTILNQYIPEVILLWLIDYGDNCVFLFIFILLLLRYKRGAYLGIAALVLSALLGAFLKWSLNIPRPGSVLAVGDFHTLGKLSYQHSFPSGHTIRSFVLFAYAYYLTSNRTLKLFLFIFAVLSGLSRIAVGAHWPLDVMMGALIPLIIFRLLVLSQQRITWPKIEHSYFYGLIFLFYLAYLFILAEYFYTNLLFNWLTIQHICLLFILTVYLFRDFNKTKQLESPS